MKSGIDPKALDELWRAPESWKWGGVYFCKEDPRIIVPKRQKWAGWTINFARPGAFPTLFALIAFVSVPMIVLSVKGYANTPIWFAVIAAEMIALCLVSWYLASRKRY